MTKNVGTEIISWLTKSVKDVATLQVASYRVDITATVKTEGADKTKVPLKDFIDGLNVTVDSGTCRVILVTQGKFDHDAVVMYASDVTEADKPFIEFHRELYEAASKARSDVVELAMRFAKGDVIK